jgi:hypothetical protein
MFWDRFKRHKYATSEDVQAGVAAFKLDGERREGVSARRIKLTVGEGVGPVAGALGSQDQWSLPPDTGELKSVHGYHPDVIVRPSDVFEHRIHPFLPTAIKVDVSAYALVV